MVSIIRNISVYYLQNYTVIGEPTINPTNTRTLQYEKIYVNSYILTQKREQSNPFTNLTFLILAFILMNLKTNCLAVSINALNVFIVYYS